jgi:poly(beta-D-mannuronate) lyase
MLTLTDQVHRVSSSSLRHGRGCRVEGNVFLGNNIAGTGGIRVTNEDHMIVNNHLQALAGAAGTDYQAGLALMDGTTPTTTNPDLSGSYVQVKNVLLAHNTLASVTRP